MSKLDLIKSKTKVLQPTATITNVVVIAGHLQITCVSHSFEIGDLVSITGVLGAVESNSPGIVASVSSNVFTLEQPVGSITVYSSGGLARHLGWCSLLVVTDNSVIDNAGDLTLNVRIEALSQNANCRIDIEDGFGADTTAETVATFNAAGAIKNSVSDYVVSRRLYQMPDLRIGNSGCFMRAKLLFPSGAPGNSATFSAWLEV